MLITYTLLILDKTFIFMENLTFPEKIISNERTCVGKIDRKYDNIRNFLTKIRPTQAHPRVASASNPAPLEKSYKVLIH